MFIVNSLSLLYINNQCKYVMYVFAIIGGNCNMQLFEVNITNSLKQSETKKGNSSIVFRFVI